MKIEDLVQLINSRLREFRLSRDYARMNGDLERMNLADKEVLALEETLYKLNLLIDVSKSVSVQENTLASVITSGSTSVLGDYDITPYATDPLHEQKILNILSKMDVMDSVEKIDNYIKGKYPSSPVTGEMVMNASSAYSVDIRLMMAMMEQDSSFGTAGKAVRTLNPGNVGNDDEGNTRTYESWQKGVTAVAEWLNRHRSSQQAVVPSEVNVPEPVAPVAPIITTTTTTTIVTNTSTPAIIPNPESATSTPDTVMTPEASSSTPAIIPNPESSTSTPSIITPETTTSTPAIITPSATEGASGEETTSPAVPTVSTSTTTIITTAPSETSTTNESPVATTNN
jgi:hypothetical protein